LERFVAYRKQMRKSVQRGQSEQQQQQQQEESSSSSKMKKKKKLLFTEEDVKLLLSHREEQIRAEYDKILQERLQEQFNQFSQFNQDYISRQFKETYV